MQPLHSDVASGQARDLSVAELVGQVYEGAPPAERAHMLEHLLQPLGVLSQVAIADGVFARVRFRSGFPSMQIRQEELQRVGSDDVVTLVDYVQQMSGEVVEGLVNVLSTSPALASSAAVVLLAAILIQRTRQRRVDPS